MIVEGSRVRIRRGWAALARGEDEFGRSVSVWMGNEHVAASAVEQFRKNLWKRSGAVLAEDAFVDDATRDLDSRHAGDLTENLVQAGVVGGDGEGIVGIGDLGTLGRLLRGGKRVVRCRRGRCRREARRDLNCSGWFGLGTWSRLRRQNRG